MMVAQAPFETGDMNQFCKLIPLAYEDGTHVDSADFPNDGQIWWMLTPYTSRLAVPGQLVMGKIEQATKYQPSVPDSSRYQAVRESIQDFNLRDGFEVVPIPAEEMDSIQDIVARDFHLRLSAPPTRSTMISWRANIYGPFNATCATPEALSETRKISFSPAHSDGVTVYTFDLKTFTQTIKDQRITVKSEVSQSGNNRNRSYDVVEIRHELVMAGGYERLLSTNPKPLVLEPVDKKLLRFAKDCLTRAKRQQLKQLLEDLDLTGQQTERSKDLHELVQQVKGAAGKQEQALVEVAEALLRSGMLGEDRISRAEQAYAQKYVEQRMAELQAKVEVELTAKRDELRKVQEEVKTAQASLQREKAEQKQRLEVELAGERKKAREELAAEKSEFEKQKTELEKQKGELQRQQGVLRDNLEKVTKNLRDAGDDVVNQFLTIAPLLKTFISAAPPPLAGQASSVPKGNDEAPAPVKFQFPAYITGLPQQDTEVSEPAFFDRFKAVVEHNGFTFRPLDLQRFHLSLKCGDITVLGGPSGTGKSSLPALYSHALLGQEATRGRPSCLMVNINPSWMDARDLVGHMNTLDGRFYPAESGIFQHLLTAQEEYKLRGGSTGLYLACLDEMNLSQVEHYFSDFMMLLERTGASRAIQCFSPETAGKNCCFRNYGTVALSPALRFVGTVNFDETTRLLSDRFLDRVNLIRLSSAGLPSAIGSVNALIQAEGRMITLSDLESWRKDGALPAHLGQFLDRMRPFLDQMGCPISPRVYRSICRFVSSAEPIISAEKAFDMQLAQRIIPKIRSLVTARQLNALDGLLDLVKPSSQCSFEESVALLEEARETSRSRGWELEK